MSRLKLTSTFLLALNLSMPELNGGLLRLLC